ncbi:MAG: hypothetical protein COW72_01890, partial [Candidatus Nealsonbacteria bacterium CG18_big_fil_WC_8_21_14_2_50_37_10]
VLEKWPRFTLALKIKKEKEKHKMETAALNKLTGKLPQNLKMEMRSLWREFEEGLTKEGRFVQQADKIANFLQGLDYWKKYGKIQYKLWLRWIKEIVDDPVLLEFVRTLENKFCKK